MTIIKKPWSLDPQRYDIIQYLDDNGVALCNYEIAPRKSVTPLLESPKPPLQQILVFVVIVTIDGIKHSS